MTGPVGYRHVNDIKKTRQLLRDAGAQAQQDVKDVGGGNLIASVKDADSNIIGLIHSAVRAPLSNDSVVHRERRDAVFRAIADPTVGKS